MSRGEQPTEAEWERISKKTEGRKTVHRRYEARQRQAEKQAEEYLAGAAVINEAIFLMELEAVEMGEEIWPSLWL